MRLTGFSDKDTTAPMATEGAEHTDRDVFSGEGSSISDAASSLKVALREVLLFGGAIVWTLFWGLVAQIHYSMGDTMATVFTVGVLVAPVVAIVLWRVASKIGVVDRDPVLVES
jgi:hypothetical protein